MTRVAICIPSGDLLHADFALSLAAMCRQTRVDKISLFNQRGSLLVNSRNLLVKDALADGATHLMWLDSDMVFPALTLDRLLAHRLPFVGATYLRRVPPHRLVGKPADDGAGALEGLTRMKVMPFGCVLVEAGVFHKVGFPHFNTEYDADGELVGEDVWFCRRAIAVGATPRNDDWLTAQLGHIGNVTHRLELPSGSVAEAA